MSQPWTEQAIWWHLHPLTFLGVQDADAPGVQDAGSRDLALADQHALMRLRPWVKYLVELGCNGLALGPVFESATHGYDVIDHHRVDARLGTEQDLLQLITECHSSGVAVLLDGVFNHVGRDFAPFKDVLEHGRYSAYANWFRLDFDAEGSDARGPDGFGYADFEGHHQLVALNHESPEVVDYVSGVMAYWLERGAAGWRLDAAYAVPLSFWHAVTDRVRQSHPDAWFVGEVIHGDYSLWVEEGALGSVTQYELWKAIWSSINDVNYFELAWTIERHNSFVQSFTPLTFAGNHDVTRIASKIEDERHLAHALVILFTLAGIPSVYAGDEQGFRGVKEDRPGGDDAVRPAFPAGPGELAPDGERWFRLHQNLIGMRRRYPWLVTAQTTVTSPRNESLVYESRSRDGRSALTVLLNLADDWLRPEADLSAAKLVLSSAGHPDAGVVEPHGWAVLET